MSLDSDQIESNQQQQNNKLGPAAKKFDIYRIDYDWIEKTESKKDLSLAYEALEEDGGFPELLKTLEKKLIKVDPVFARRVEGRLKLSEEQSRLINDDMDQFL